MPGATDRCWARRPASSGTGPVSRRVPRRWLGVELPLPPGGRHGADRRGVRDAPGRREGGRDARGGARPRRSGQRLRARGAALRAGQAATRRPSITTARPSPGRRRRSGFTSRGDRASRRHERRPARAARRAGGVAARVSGVARSERGDRGVSAGGRRDRGRACACDRACACVRARACVPRLRLAPAPATVALGARPPRSASPCSPPRSPACTKCALSATRTQTVFARGNPEAQLCFVGEAPGADEDAQGLPFVGRAGQLLDA